MSFVNKIFPLWIFLSFTAAAVAVPQSLLNKQFEYAHTLFITEKYFDAITEFKRLQFFDSLNQFSYTSNKLIGLSYKHGGRFNEAIEYLSIAELNSTEIDSLFDIKIEIVKTNLLRRTIFRAFDLLKDLSDDKRFTEKKVQISYWLGWVYIFNDEWDKAASEFLRAQNQDLAQLCENVDDVRLSPTKAKILSYIFPGSGQFYTGNYLSGLLSLSWIALWTNSIVHALISERYFDAFMVADFLWLRFYNGNLQNAEKFAEQHNEEASHWMLNYLKNNYMGQKP
jgi:tetratricopeptide (TPR) repeat protein